MKLDRVGRFEYNFVFVYKKSNDVVRRLKRIGFSNYVKGINLVFRANQRM